VTGGAPLDRHASTPAELKARIAAERRGTPFLTLRDEAGHQAIVELAGSQLTIGRRADNDVVIDWDPEVSRLHAQLEHIKGDWCVVDDGLSRNGTYLNGDRVRGRHRLRDGDRLCCGATIVVYRAPAESESKSTLAVTGPVEDVQLSDAQRKVLIVLCRPMGESAFAPPAPNRKIAEELFLSVDSVKAHLRVLFERFGVDDLPQNQKRASLAASALLSGVIKPSEL
jgi:pSer/pThr/pTyr-binding forkhead associated (FHA) protein